LRFFSIPLVFGMRGSGQGKASKPIPEEDPPGNPIQTILLVTDPTAAPVFAHALNR
jgi:hypothetical protein